MTIPDATIGFGCAGLLGLIWLVIAIRRGVIWVDSDSGPLTTRKDYPFRFYSWAFFCALISILFLGAAVLHWIYPDASLTPTPRLLESDLVDWAK